MTAHTDFNLPTGDELAAKQAAALAVAIAACPEAEHHESGPFRYCQCGWMEAVTAVELTQAEKIDYLYVKAVTMESLLEQAAPLLAQAGPMLESLAPLLGQANSPMGRIFGSMLR